MIYDIIIYSVKKEISKLFVIMQTQNIFPIAFEKSEDIF